MKNFEDTLAQKNQETSRTLFGCFFALLITLSRAQICFLEHRLQSQQ